MSSWFLWWGTIFTMRTVICPTQSACIISRKTNFGSVGLSNEKLCDPKKPVFMTSSLRHERAGPAGANTCALKTYEQAAHTTPRWTWCLALLSWTLVWKWSSINTVFLRGRNVWDDGSTLPDHNKSPQHRSRSQHFIWNSHDCKDTNHPLLWSLLLRSDVWTHFPVIPQEVCCKSWINGDVSSFTQPIFPLSNLTWKRLSVWLPSLFGKVMLMSEKLVNGERLNWRRFLFEHCNVF